jgi:hypothetical protein
MEEVRLEIGTDDTKYFYRRLEHFTIRIPISPSNRTLFTKLEEISIQYKLTQESNYTIKEINKTFTLIRKLSSQTHYFWDIESYYGYDHIKRFLKSVEYRLNWIIKGLLLERRPIKTLLGNFEESVSPNMIQKILTWLKKKNKHRYGEIKRGMKEDIIIDLRTYGIIINPEFLCEFINDNNPMCFVKEWKVKTHLNGKRMKNTEIRELFKEAFYKRERDCVRFKMICPSLNCLPKNIEDLIVSYL